MDIYLERYINNILDRYFDSKYRQNSSYFNFRCNICGDSCVNKHKKRAYILKDKNHYYCHNCHASMNVKKWMKLYFPDIYNHYIGDLLLDKPIKNKEPILKVEKRKKGFLESDILQIKNFIPLNDNKHKNNKYIIKAKEYISERQIPEKVTQKWMFALSGRYKNRIIIPFYDNKNKMYYFQGRTVVNQEPKYLNTTKNKDTAVYNISNVDEQKEVMVTEGVIDSLFLDNSVSVLSTKWTNRVQEIIDDYNCHFIMDNDVDGRKKANKLLNDGYSVFLWYKYLKDHKIECFIKDINDLYLYQRRQESYTFEELKKYFSNNLIDKIYL